ncbi:MAG: hypothetical protein ACYSR9_03355 [Planctomycetota bacterium]|jgi:molecular chaperone GrpE (heat shock protein)
MLKKYVIPGLVILLAGATVLGWLLVEKNKEHQEAAYYKSKYGSEPDNYLKQYNEWLQSDLQARAYLPWGLDENGKQKTEVQLQKEQQERLKADLDKLAAGKTDASPFADILYGKNWQEELSKYKKQKEQRESIFTISILCTFTGGAILTCCLLSWIGQRLNKASSQLRKSVAVSLRDQEPNKDKELAKADANEKIKPEAKAKPKVKAEFETQAKAKAERTAKTDVEKVAKNQEKARAKIQTQVKVRGKVEAKAKVKEERIDKAETEKVAKNQEKARTKAQTQVKVRGKVEAKAKVKEERIDKAETEKVVKAESKSRKKDETEKKVGVSVEDGKTMNQHQERRGLRRRDKKQTKALGNSDWNTCKQDSANNTAVLIKDEKSIELVESLESTAKNVNVNNKNEDSLKEKTENLEKQMAEFRQMAQGVQQTAIENSKPINNTLSELTQQVSAIREYASSQQNRLTKLQDGYDWNITKTFCLRVIRCIDNLEKRISQLLEKDMEVVDLEEVKDEMLFALESSGVEQYEPEINSDYHGQEKCAEAVKGKESCDDKKQTGKIAKIIRPGYQFFIDEENVKIVRPAQVKLYG